MEGLIDMTYLADVDTIASQVKKGDIFRRVNGSTATELVIASVKVSAKWTVAREEDGSLIFRKENDEQVWVVRETKTEEELAAEKELAVQKAHEFRIEMLQKMHQRMHDGVHAARAAMAAKLSEPNGFVSADIVEDLMFQQEYKTIACQIDSGLEHHPEWTIIECMDVVAGMIKESLIDGRNEPTQSGGFTFRNAGSQAKMAAQRKFLQGIAWGIL